MKILVINGSPRNGNTKMALEAITKNAVAEVVHVDITKKEIKGCTACEKCNENQGKCVLPDDTNEIIDNMKEADIIIFGTPVYWWGISAQLKLIIDKMYCAVEELTGNKKIGIVSVGEDVIEGPQYRLISEQFDCICKHMHWNKFLDISISANKIDDLRNDKSKVEELEAIVIE